MENTWSGTASPIKASVDGKQCVVMIKVDCIVIKLVKYQKVVSVEYTDIRCVQLTGDSVLINVSNKDQKLVVYKIKCSHTKRVHDALLSRITSQ